MTWCDIVSGNSNVQLFCMKKHLPEFNRLWKQREWREEKPPGQAFILSQAFVQTDPSQATDEPNAPGFYCYVA
jgi:hypothetical protein